MLTVSLLLCALVALSRANDVAPNNTPLCQAGWRILDRQCFHYVEEELSWADAEVNCQKLNGNLASVHSEVQVRFLHSLVPLDAAKGFWVGGSDCYKEGTWMWSDGSVFDFTYWCPTKPNLNENQNCLETVLTGCKCWNDVACNETRPSICRTNQ